MDFFFFHMERIMVDVRTEDSKRISCWDRCGSSDQEII